MLRQVESPQKSSRRARPTGIRPPRHLSAAARKIWRLIETQWELDDGARFNLLVALKNFDRGEAAAELVRTEGIMIDGKPHPGIRIMKDCDLVMLKAWRSIGLDVEPPSHNIGRPPGSHK